MYSCLYISFSFCFCLKNVRCNSTVLLLHFQSKTLFAFLLFQHSLPNFVSVQKSTSASDQSMLRLRTCNQPLAVNEEPEVPDGEWQFDIKQQFCWNDHSCDCLLLYFILQILWESSLLRLKRSFFHCYDFLRLRNLFLVCSLCWWNHQTTNHIINFLRIKKVENLQKKPEKLTGFVSECTPLIPT